MKRKVLALFLAAVMTIQPLSVAGAAEFTDGQQVEVESVVEDLELGTEKTVDVFTDEVPEEPVVEEEKVEEGSVAPSETAVQMGDDVWAEYDKNTRIATVSGTGAMWDYLSEGLTLDKQHKNPFRDWSYVNKIVFNDGITHISNHLKPDHALNSVIFPKGLISIGESAFFDCFLLSEINLPDGVTHIGDSAFAGCSMSEMKLPESLISIGKTAFLGCKKLSKINLPDGVTHMGDSVFYNCILLDNVHIPQGVRELPYGLFRGCGFLSTVILPDGLKKIGNDVFYNCIRLEKITIPPSVKDMGINIFQGCANLKKIRGYTCSTAKKYYNSLPENQKQKITFESLGEGIHEWSNEAEIIKYPTCEVAGEKAFRCNICGELSGDKIEISALGHEWSGWTTTKEPTETEDGERQHTCYNCGKVETQYIQKLSSIRFYEQYVGWKNCDELIISAELNKPVYFYVKCIKAGEAKPEFDEKKLDKTVNPDAYLRKEIVVPEEPVTVYLFVQDKDGNNTYTILEPNYVNRPEKPATTIKVGDDITATIEGDTLTLTGSGATYDYEYYGERWYKGDRSAIKNIVFNGDITYIGNCFFTGFMGISDLKFPEGLQRMGRGVLDACHSLETVTFPSTLKEIPTLTEEDTSKSLTTVIIPEGVESIGEGAFCNCTSLTDIKMPTSIKKIGKYAFCGTGIDTFDWPSTVEVIPESVFSSSKLSDFKVPKEVVKIEKDAFNNCNNLEKIIIPKTVSYIGNYAFFDCPMLKIFGERDSQAEQYAYINNIPFKSDYFKVIFKEDGRTINDSKLGKVQYILKGENATPPTLTPRPGYTLSWDADYTNIIEDMVINAVWTKNGSDKPEPPIIITPPSEKKFTVTFKDRGKTIKTEKVVSGEAADFPYVSRPGYELSWDKDFSNVTSNMTVNAVWTVIKPAKVTSLTGESLPKYARLSWDETEYTSYYLVYRKAAEDKDFKQVAKTTKVLWNDRKVKPGNEYQYKVVAVRAVEGKKHQGEYSDIVTVKIGAPETGDIYSVGKLNYKVVNSGEVRVAGLAKVTGSVNIPNTVTISGKVYKVTSIDQKAFYRNENLVDVKIGNNVNYIGKYAFFQCPNLESVKFGRKVRTISTCAFTQCPKLGNITLPASLERLGAKAFFKCTSMRVLTVKSSRLSYIGKKALAINSKVTIRLPKAKYSAYVKMIKKSGRYAATKFQKF